MTKRIVVCTAKYSDNLGDGVISDSVEYLIGQLDRQYIVQHLDISGRDSYSVTEDLKPSLTKIIFHKAPRALRPLVTLLGWAAIFRGRLEKQVRSINFKQADLLIFGGGQLLSDVALNFPLKISFITRRARQAALPYTFSGVGVAKHFSAAAKMLLKPVFASNLLKYIAVRDNDSCLNIQPLLGPDTVAPQLTVDSGLWAADCYGLTATANLQHSEYIKVGVGISHPMELSAHVSDGHQENFDYHKFWLDLLRDLLKQGYQPILFTNGSRDDHAFLTEIKEKLISTDLADKVQIAERFFYPNQLAEFISSLNGVISHRLHANIVCHSFLLPGIALAWDPKVQSYYNLIGKADWCISDTTETADIVRLFTQSLSERLSIESILPLKERSLKILKTQIEECSR